MPTSPKRANTALPATANINVTHKYDQPIENTANKHSELMQEPEMISHLSLADSTSSSSSYTLLKGFNNQSGLFSKYANIIFTQLNQKNTDPKQLLHALLQAYQEGTNSVSSLWGIARGHLNFAKSLQALLVKEPNINVSIVFKELETTKETFNPNGEFIILWSAFLSFYPLYLLDLNPCEFKNQLKITSLNSVLSHTIFQKHADGLLQKKTEQLTDSDTELLLLTNRFDEFMAIILHKLDKEPQSIFLCFKTLASVVPFISSKKIVEQILPVLLTSLSEHHENYSAHHLLLNAIIKKIPKNIISEKILPVLITSPQNNDYFFSTPLTAIAHQVGADITSSIIFPKLMEGLRTNNNKPDSQTNQSNQIIIMESIFDLLTLIKPQQLYNDLLPKLIEESPYAFYSEPVKLKILSRLYTIIQTSRLSSDRLILKEMIEKLRPFLFRTFPEAIKEYASGKWTKISDYIIVLTEDEIKNIILPNALSSFNDKQPLLEIFKKISTLHTNRISPGLKHKICINLINQLNGKLSVPLIDTIDSYLPFCTDKAVLQTLFITLLEKIDFNIEAKSHTIESSIFNLLITSLKYINPEMIQSQLIDPLLIKNNVDLHSDKRLDLLTTALNYVSIDYLKSTVLPRLLHNVNHTESSTKLFINIVPRLSYEDCVFYTTQYINSADRQASLEILVALIKRQDVLTQNREDELSLDFSPEEHLP